MVLVRTCFPFGDSANKSQQCSLHHTAIIISEHVEENPKIHTQQPIVSCLVDPERFDADPDPTFQADADPDPAPDTNPFTMVIHFFSSNLQLLFPKSSKTCHV